MALYNLYERNSKSSEKLVLLTSLCWIYIEYILTLVKRRIAKLQCHSQWKALTKNKRIPLFSSLTFNIFSFERVYVASGNAAYSYHPTTWYTQFECIYSIKTKIYIVRGIGLFSLPPPPPPRPRHRPTPPSPRFI